MNILINLLYQLVFFGAVGGCAAVVHLLVVLLLVHFIQIAPLVANVFAFLIAFNISYLGHKNYTFAGHREQQKELSLPHFFLVAASGGMLNEFLYYLLLHYTQIHYLLALVFDLGLVAIYSFCLSKFWACRQVRVC